MADRTEMRTGLPVGAMDLSFLVSSKPKGVKNFKQMHQTVTRLTVSPSHLIYNNEYASLWEPAANQQAGSTRISLSSAPA